MNTLRVATYNIHRCHGTDKRVDPRRVMRVIEELNADVVGLQEVDSGLFIRGGRCQADQIGGMPGYHAIRGPTIATHTARYGNLLISRWPVVEFKLIDLGVRFREPRGAIYAILKVKGRFISIVNLHLGLGGGERQSQYRRLASVLAESIRPQLILGDFNEWSPWRRAIEPLGLSKSSARLVRSFPSWRPILPVDRIYAQPASVLKTIAAHRSELSRVASDHLPVAATVAL